MSMTKQILLVFMTAFMIYGCNNGCNSHSSSDNPIGNLPDGSNIHISQPFYILNAGAEEDATVYFFGRTQIVLHKLVLTHRKG